MKKITVIGSTGMLGYAVSEYFKRKNYNVLEVSRKEFDIAKESIEKLESFINGSDAVINCAGVIKPRIAAMSIEDVIRVNSIFPHNLAKLSNRLNIKCFHITTDCVYSGKKGNYTEEDYFDADDIYGMTKNAGESANCMVLRTSIIGEEIGQSRSLLEWARGQVGKEVNGYTNHKWNGVTTLYLAEIIEDILKKNLYKKGLFHIFSLDTVDKYKLLQIFNEIYNLRFVKTNATLAKDVIDRSMATIYDLSSKLCVKNIQQQIKEMHDFFQNNEV